MLDYHLQFMEESVCTSLIISNHSFVFSGKLPLAWEPLTAKFSINYRYVQASVVVILLYL